MATATIQNRQEEKSMWDNTDRIKTIPAKEPISRIDELSDGETLDRQFRPEIGCIASWIDGEGKQLGISKIGPAFRGMITRTTKRLKELGLNIDEGLSSKMESSFTTTLIISGPREKLARLYDDIHKHPHEPPEGDRVIKQSITDEILIIGENRSGMVYDLSECLNYANINIATMAIKTKDIPDPEHPDKRICIGIVHAKIEVPSAEAMQKFDERIRATVSDFPSWHVEFQGRNGKKLLNQSLLSKASLN